MNLPDKQEVKEKEKRVKAYMEQEGYDGVVIGRQDNFAWFTDGGNNRVITLTESGAAWLVITKSKKYLLAYVMDGGRIMEEELLNLDFEYVPLHWYEPSLEDKAVELINGQKILSDIPIKTAHVNLDVFYELHYPLTLGEIDKMRVLGATADEVLTKVANQVEPGMSEHEIEAKVLFEFGKLNIQCTVLLIGSDERISKYRHPLPSKKTLENYLLLAPVPKKCGLNCPLTRLVYFGNKIPEEVQRKYEAVRNIAIASISMCRPGIKFCDILAVQKSLYKEYGFEQEWKNHFQGGVTGYQLVNANHCNNAQRIIQTNEAYAWFITITGTKTEELSVNIQGEQEILTAAGKWPVKKCRFQGNVFSYPEIMLRT